MIAYLDTSVLVPLVVSEPTSTACGVFWDGADRIVCTRLGYVEAVAALASAVKLGRVTRSQLVTSRTVLDELWMMVDVIELDEDLMRSAGAMADRHGLRGYDATHCAAAVLAGDDQLVAGSGDRQLLAAWQSEGLSVFDPRSS